MLARGGFRPFNRKLGKTRSSFVWYGVSLRHSCSEFASNGCKGTGLFDALLLGGPNLPYTYERLTRMHEWSQSMSDQRNARISLMRSPVSSSLTVFVRMIHRYYAAVRLLADVH